LRSVGFQLRRESPVELKELIIKLQTGIHKIKQDLEKHEAKDAESVNQRLKFMIESINAIKNNDVRRLTDAFDQEPIEQIKKQMKVMVKDADQTLLNITYKDLINADELGRWWIVGSAWNLKENQKSEGNEISKSKATESEFMSGGEGFSEKILQLAKAQHMNTDVRRAVFCIIVSAEVLFFLS
jgi:nucleolar MIF4G domain-containing protein 1